MAAAPCGKNQFQFQIQIWIRIGFRSSASTTRISAHFALCQSVRPTRVNYNWFVMAIHTRTYIYTLCRDRPVVAAIVGLFISVVSLSTCVTFRRNVFIMSAINQYAQSSNLCTLHWAEGCRTSLLSNSERESDECQVKSFNRVLTVFNFCYSYSFWADRIIKFKREDRLPFAYRKFNTFADSYCYR